MSPDFFTDTTKRMTPHGYYELTGPQKADLFRRFEALGMRTNRSSLLGDTIQAETGYPRAQISNWLGRWRVGEFDAIPLPPEPEHEPEAVELPQLNLSEILTDLGSWLEEGAELCARLAGKLRP